MASMWRAVSYSMARLMAAIEAMFFISVRTPSSVLPAGRTDKFTSARIVPFSMRAPDTFANRSKLRRRSRYATTSSALRRSGWLTISISGTLVRLKSTSEVYDQLSWTSLPASSSIWICLTRMSLGPSSVWMVTYPFTAMGANHWVV